MTKKFRRSLELPKAWEVKATTLKELNDREKMDFFDFIENLKTYKIKMKEKKKGIPQRRKR